LAVGIGVIVALRLATFANRGPSGYRDPAVLTDVSFWFLTAIVVISIVDFAGRFLPGLEGRASLARRATVAILFGAYALAAAFSFALEGIVWGFPLADLVWWLNTAYLVQLVPAFALAALLGTPGCEQGVWSELLDRRGSSQHTTLSCAIGLHVLDDWEAHRFGRRGG
jgi:hypothetical protein